MKLAQLALAVFAAVPLPVWTVVETGEHYIREWCFVFAEDHSKGSPAATICDTVDYTVEATATESGTYVYLTEGKQTYKTDYDDPDLDDFSHTKPLHHNYAGEQGATEVDELGSSYVVRADNVDCRVTTQYTLTSGVIQGAAMTQTCGPPGSQEPDESPDIVARGSR